MKNNASHSGTLVHRVHGVLLRLFWRTIAPKHPRGWLDLHPVLSDDGATAWLHTHGMERWKLANIEFQDVPVDLLGPAHGILLAITEYMKCEKPIQADESIGGYFHSKEQGVVHQATLRRSPEPEPGHEDLLRVVDHEEPATSRFPMRLFAAHLIALADSSRDPRSQEDFFRKAIRIYPGDTAGSTVGLEARQTNPNNFAAWEGLGFALAAQRRFDEACTAFDQAVLRWPVGAAGFAEFIAKEVEEGRAPPASDDLISKYWCTLNVDEARQRAFEDTSCRFPS